MTPPSENDDTTEYPKSLLQSFGVCSRLLRSASLYTLAYVHITPGGELCCSDGRQALGVMTPYKFECEDTTLMYCGRLFTSNDIRRRKSFRMGFVGRTVHFDFGDFHYWCHPSIDRYPNMDNTIPKEETIQTRLTLDPRDAIFLKKHLMNLPGRKENHAPITLLCDYDNTVSVHGSETNCGDTKALLLTRSSYSGDAYALRTNRKYLFDAISRGCRDFRLGTRYPLALMENVRLCWIQLSGSALPLESERPSPPVVLLRSNENPNEKPL